MDLLVWNWIKVQFSLPSFLILIRIVIFSRVFQYCDALRSRYNLSPQRRGNTKSPCWRPKNLVSTRVCSREHVLGECFRTLFDIFIYLFYILSLIPRQKPFVFADSNTGNNVIKLNCALSRSDDCKSAGVTVDCFYWKCFPLMKQSRWKLRLKYSEIQTRLEFLRLLTEYSANKHHESVRRCWKSIVTTFCLFPHRRVRQKCCCPWQHMTARTGPLIRASTKMTSC